MKHKKGFSLIEVLMVMGIIAVVTAIGFSITNSGMKKAYNQYWYTGYSTINDIIYDGIRTDKIHPSGPDVKPELEAHLKRFFPDRVWGNTQLKVNAPNNIEYTITPKSTEDSSFYEIDMKVPTTNGDSFNKTRLIFRVDNKYTDTNIRVFPANYDGTDNNFLNLHDRPDLLPFYLTKGDSGTFYSFKDAYCARYESLPAIDNTSFPYTAIDCDNVGSDTNLGKLMHISPRKAY